MHILKSLRNAFARVAGRKPSNDNSPPIIPGEDKLRLALNPPADNTVEVLHGVSVADPFRPLEKLDAPETADWVKRQNQNFEFFIFSASKVEARTIRFLENAVPKGMREGMPNKYGDKYIVRRKEETDARVSYYIKDVPDYDAPARLLLNPMQIDPSGKTDIVGFNVTHDGKTLATLSASPAATRRH